MQQSHPDSTAVAQVSAGLDRLLGNQLARIRRRFLTHGLGWLLALVCAIFLVYFLVDRSLQLPSGVRLLLSLAILVQLAVALRRRVVYPMTRTFGLQDVAIAIERRFPELREKLITAIQLKGALGETDSAARERALRNQSAAMVERVVAEAARESERVPVEQLLDSGRSARVWAASAALAAVAVTSALWNPASTKVFMQRVLGLSAVYPRMTTLIVELPPNNLDYQIVRGLDGTANVTMAAGADLTVLVLARGKVPREVFLDVSGGRGMPPEVLMTQRPGGRFRHQFRRVHADFAFHARGGDDDHGDLVVTVSIVRPPLVGTVSAVLTYPPYTRLPDQLHDGGTVEALEGTRVELTVTATSAVDQAELFFLESDRRVPMDPVTLQDDSGAGQTFRGGFVVDSSDRYQVELLSPSGLRNPNPGTYPIIALKDHGPVGSMLLPSGEDISVVIPGALIPVRIEAKDDYGLIDVQLVTRSGRSEVENRFQLLDGREDDPPTTERVLTFLLDLTRLGEGEHGPAVGDSIVIAPHLTDNKAPEGTTTELSKRQVHVVDRADLARRIAGHFRRLREQVIVALDLQEDRQAVLAGVLEDPPTEDPGAPHDTRLISVEVGQGRILAAAQRIHREFMRAYNVHLFNRLEDSIHAPKVVELYDRYHRADPDSEPFLPGFYRKLAEEQREGRIGAMEKTLDPILSMTVRSDLVASDLAPRAVREMEASQVASGAARIEHLKGAHQLQAKITEELAALLSRLEEWNEFQDVIQQTRALRDQQRDVENRTRAVLGERK